MEASRSQLSRTSWQTMAVLFAPAAVLLGLVVLYPIARTLALGFFHLNLATSFQAHPAGWDNYLRLALDSRFQNSLWVTGSFTLASVALEFAIGLVLALAVENLVHGRGLVRTLFLVPWTLPTAIVAVLWAWIYNDPYGALNALLEKAHVIQGPVAWLGGAGTALLALVVADVWKTTPFVFLVLLAGLQNIPKELYEAVEIDGGRSWAKFRYVAWPHLLPFVFVALIFRIIQAFAIFDLPYVMTGGGPGGATETVSMYSYETFMRYLDIGYGSAQVVAVIVILAATALALYQLLLKRYARLF